MADETDIGEPAGQIVCKFAKRSRLRLSPSSLSRQWNRFTNSGSNLYDEMFTVMVGPLDSEKSFPVYRQLLCSASKYFDNMLNGGFAESGSKTLSQTDVDARSFQSFYYWLNSGHVDCLDSSPDPRVVRKNIIDAYALADYYVAPKLKNALADCLYDHIERTHKILFEVTLKLYATTTTEDPIRKLVADITAKSHGFDGFEVAGSKFPQSFLFDLLCALKRFGITPGGTRFKRRAYRADMETHFCERYHDH